MKSLSIFKVLGPIDLKNIKRDSFLAWMMLAPLLAALAFRWGTPPLTTWLAAEFSFDLSPYYPLLMSFFTLLGPALIGMIVGFLLLDERDDRTLMALQVTPLRLRGYLIYRITMPIILSVAVTVIVFPLAKLVSVPFGSLLVIALLSALEAPLFALGLAAFAENKVTGFALTKGSGALLIFPIIAYFIEMPWQLLAGLIPTYWPAKLFWIASEGGAGFWIYFLAGMALNLGLLFLLLKRFERVMTR